MNYVRLVEKLEKIARFSLGPSVERVLITFLMASDALGEPNDAKNNVLVGRCDGKKYAYCTSKPARTKQHLDPERPCYL
jgi:hypothetical protein